MLLILQSVDRLSREETEREYSKLVQTLENRTHNTEGFVIEFIMNHD